MKAKLSIITAGYIFLAACGSDSDSSPAPAPTNEEVTETNSGQDETGDLATGEYQFYEEGGFAIGGTDPVAYFTAGEPTPGTDAFTYQWSGSMWKFSSQENLDSFKADPEAFAPQFGGFCAYAVSRNYKAKSTPEAWNIVDGKLYLNLSLSVKATWEQDIPGNIALGNANWPSLRD